MEFTRAQLEIFEQKARNLVEQYNPYIKKAVAYHIDGKEMYLYANQSLTREEIDAAYYETALKDIKNGFKERMVGYYDKWYRYNHADQGWAYDTGVRMAADTEECPVEFNIIECTA